MSTTPGVNQGNQDGKGMLDPSDGDDLLGGLAGKLGFRERLRRNPGLNIAYRVGVGVVGGAVLVLGFFAIPYPGPGWLIVFAGLAILATEFAWAERVLRFAKGKYDRWVAWLRRQHLAVRLLVMGLTCLVVLTTIYMLNVFSLVGGWFGIHWEWLKSPLPFLRS
ncbi:TIGR02611 family protein [Rhizohabitans arisaemae]|uniref:TIGR02611 family protein n=1 Tax=Rhizohabitans arisaemae TaxID=2720610 RepID=UPI0024B1D1D4|nr:TIGR02611 family protein [Rhizohabitans arisaemae]